MLSYQHAFHAGNHADVLKHLVMIAVLEKLNKKAKPYFALDTHAGAGIYDIANAPKSADEFAFKKLLQLDMLDHATDAHSSVEQYLSLLQKYALKQLYPGSPLILSECARHIDSIHANELATAMYEQLEQCVKTHLDSGKRLHLHHKDAFASMKALLPPHPKRGVVLIDPPYEQACEYEDVLDAICAAITKWPKGIYLLWYPLLSPNRINRTTQVIEPNPKAKNSGQMLKALKASISAPPVNKHCTGGMLTIEFANTQPSEKTGMYGSGMCIINPPYELHVSLQSILQTLDQHVRVDSNNLSSLTWHVEAQ